MEQLKQKALVKDAFLIIVGCFLYAIANNFAFEPMNLVTGGVTGLAIVVKAITSYIIPGGIPVWLFNALSNVPLFIAAYFILGKTFVKRTLFATVCLTLALYLVPKYPIVTDDFLLAAVFGGVVGGIGMGMIFMTMSSTGGTDIIAMIIHKYKKYYSIPQILIVIDGIIILMGIMVFDMRRALYAGIGIYVFTKVSDSLLEGIKFAKMAYIISDSYDAIAKEILTKMERGVTGLSATGMYSNQDKKMLFCVVSKKEIVQITEIAKQCDPNAFIIVTDVREAMGEGFIEYKQ